MIILRFLWPNSMGLICFFVDLILGFCLQSPNSVGRFFWMSFLLLCLLATLVPKKFVLCYLGVFDGPLYCCFANRW